MESEKVKEIKKALECCRQNEIENTCEYCSNCPASDWDYETECNVELFQKTITLINKLERKLKAKEGYYNAVKNMALAVFAERVIEKLKNNVNADNVDCFVNCKKILNETLKELQGE